MPALSFLSPYGFTHKPTNRKVKKSLVTEVLNEKLTALNDHLTSQRKGERKDLTEMGLENLKRFLKYSR